MPEVFTDLADFEKAVQRVAPDHVVRERRRKPRDFWTPAMLRVYGIMPWEMGRFKIREIHDLNDDLREFGI